MSTHITTHLSQINTVGPAMRLRTSSCDCPQKEHLIPVKGAFLSVLPVLLNAPNSRPISKAASTAVIAPYKMSTNIDFARFSHSERLERLRNQESHDARLTIRFQPLRLMIMPAAVGCKPC